MNNLNDIRPPEAYASIRDDSEALGFDMPGELAVHGLLRTLVAARPAARCLELGTGTGLATAWILDGLDARGRLSTVDNDERWLAVARRHLGHDPRLSIFHQDGDEFLRRTAAGSERFDLIFADTWSGKYRLLDEAISLLAPGGLYVVDDMLPQSNWPEGHATKVEALIRDLGRRETLRLCSLDWASGVILAARP